RGTAGGSLRRPRRPPSWSSRRRARRSAARRAGTRGNRACGRSRGRALGGRLARRNGARASRASAPRANAAAASRSRGSPARASGGRATRGRRRIRRSLRRAIRWPFGAGAYARRARREVARPGAFWLDARPMDPGFLPKLFRRLDRKRSAKRREPSLPVDLQSEAKFVAAYERCRAYTMTSPERMYALWNAARHVVAAGIAGDFVECGVWKGGSSMLAALALADAGDVTRPLWLYDTFEGMSEPTADDVDHKGHDARPEWEAAKRTGE